LGDKGWTKTDVEKFQPIVPRDWLIDLAAHKGVDVLPGTYAITAADLQATLDRQGIALQPGDAIMIRTRGRTVWPDTAISHIRHACVAAGQPPSGQPMVHLPFL